MKQQLFTKLLHNKKTKMTQDFYIYFPYQRTRKGNTDSVQKQKEKLAWTREDEEEALENEIYDIDYQVDEAQQRLSGNLSKYEYTEEKKQEDQQIVENGPQLSEHPIITISLGLGAAHAFPVYIRSFAIAQYRKLQEELEN